MPLNWQTAALLALSFKVVVGTSCYYPDGSLATDYVYVPCGSSGESACCIPDEGDKCLSNGLCLFTSDYIYRGACTDRTWQSPNCPQFCTKTNGSNEFEKLDICTGTNYHCDSDTSTGACDDPTLVFNIGSPSIINGYGVATSNPSSNTVILSPSNARSTAVPTSRPNSQTGSQQNAQQQNSQQTSQPGSQPVGTAGSSMSTSTATAIGSGIGTAALIGIIVGVVLLIGLACVGAGVFLCVRRSHRRKAVMTGNLIDMNPSHNVSGVSTVAMLPAQTQGVNNWVPSPQSQAATTASWVQSPESPVGGWENQAEYYVPHYQQTPTGSQGQNLVELHTAVSPPPTKERFSVAELA